MKAIKGNYPKQDTHRPLCNAIYYIWRMGQRIGLRTASYSEELSYGHAVKVFGLWLCYSDVGDTCVAFIKRRIPFCYKSEF